MAATGSSDCITTCFSGRSTTILDSGTSWQCFSHARILLERLKDSAELSHLWESPQAGFVCHCCFLPTWLASYSALHVGSEVRQT